MPIASFHGLLRGPAKEVCSRPFSQEDRARRAVAALERVSPAPHGAQAVSVMALDAELDAGFDAGGSKSPASQSSCDD
jgi:hypothetical protein